MWNSVILKESEPIIHLLINFLFLFMYESVDDFAMVSDCLPIFALKLQRCSMYFLRCLPICNYLCKGLSVNEDYDYLWAVHSFDVEKFEFSVVLFLLLSSECGVSFYWGPARVNFDSSLFWNCIFTTEKNCGAGISNFNTNEFSWTTGNQM